MLDRFWSQSTGSFFTLALSIAAPLSAVTSQACAQTASSEAIALPTLTVEGEDLPGSGNVKGYLVTQSRSSTRTDTALIDVPQSVTVIAHDVIKDLGILSMGDAARYVPGVMLHQGESNRDQFVFRGNSTSADFFIDGARDDVQYFRDLYNVDHVEFLKGPNAMAFGRGGSGGVVNRVTKEASWEPVREITLSGGSFDHKRGLFDLGDRVSDQFAARLNGMYEDSGTFRRFGKLERYGINPSVTFALDESTLAKAGYEFFHDHRFNDRGIPSFNGAPFPTDPATFFGNSNSTYSNADINSVYALLEHDFGSVSLRNYARYANNHKIYSNVYAGSAVSNAGTLSIVAYNNLIDRQNFTNQTDLTTTIETGPFSHRLLAGAEIGVQDSAAFRNTGFFNNATTSVAVSALNPVTFTPVTFRQSATDANSRSTVNVEAGYLQDQMVLTNQIRLIAGLRFDRFALDFHDKRSGSNFHRTDNLLSPRIGLLFKPIEQVSLYASYSVTYLPSAGDQFSTLTAQTQALKPESLNNYEVGAKWDILPRFNATMAVYRLDRTNTRAVDPANPPTFVLTGASRTRGLELGVAGYVTDQWQVMGGYAFQDAVIAKTTTAARAGSKVALVPKHSISIWNRYDITEMWGLGLGVINQSDQYAAVDDAVKLPGFTRADGAIFLKFDEDLRVQLNVENIVGTNYFLTADGNNNISPGATRTFRATATVKF